LSSYPRTDRSDRRMQALYSLRFVPRLIVYYCRLKVSYTTTLLLSTFNPLVPASPLFETDKAEENPSEHK
jgi:hypothetical protein